MTKTSISKSQYIKGINCQRALWIDKNRKDLIPEIDAATQARFDVGNIIGELAMQYFNSGIEVKNEYWDINGGVKTTQQYIADGNDIIFEATAINPNDGTYSRIDVLKKVPNSDEWDMIEVKSSTGLKDYHKDDLSFQYRVFTGAGYKIRKCFMMLIDNSYVKNGKIEPKKLFKLEEITSDVLEQQNDIEEAISELIKLIKDKDEPSLCDKPHKCDYCSPNIPKYSVYNLFHHLKVQGVVDEHGVKIDDLPIDLKASGIKDLDLQSYRNKEIIIDKEKISEFLNEIKYPIYFLDYETINPAVPLFDGTRPYQQIPFQFSLHIQHEPNGELEHHEFLHKEISNPLEDITKSLVNLCESSGSIIVYNESFEKTRNKELAEAFPKYADDIKNINNRIIDLMKPFMERSLYSYKQQSSYSIKMVLPAFVPELSYDEMDIGDGSAAMDAYTKFAMGEVSEVEQQKLWEDLSKYCKLDTYATVKLLEVLIKYSK